MSITLKPYVERQLTKLYGWPKQWQLLIIIVCMGLLMLLLQLLLGSYLSNHMVNNRITIQHLQQQLQQQKRTIIDGQKSGQLQTLPPLELATIVTQLTALARASQLEFNSIKPLAQYNTHNMTVQPLQITTNGHYPQLNQFLSQLSGLSLPCAAHNFSIAAHTGAELGEALQLSLVIDIYTGKHA